MWGWSVDFVPQIKSNQPPVYLCIKNDKHENMTTTDATLFYLFLYLIISQLLLFITLFFYPYLAHFMV